MVTHTDKAIIRTADGRISELTEHSFLESASTHALHSKSNAEALRAHERVIEEKTNLKTQLSEFRGRVVELQELLAVSTEALHSEQRLRTDIEAKLLGRERQLRIAQAREKQIVADAKVDAQIALKNTPSPVGLVAPDPGQSAEEYLALLADLELQIVDMEKRSAPIHWVLAPSTVASEATS